VSYATIDDLRSQLGGETKAEDYDAKMMHPIPPAGIVKREEFICRQAKGKRVLELGASGKLHEALREVSVLVGIDRVDSDDVIGFDLDDVYEDRLPVEGKFDLIVAGEIIEHLGNPLWLLTRLKRQFPGVPLIVSVPNAFSSIAQKHIARGVENVNKDHVAWYSPKTISVLMERAGYETGALYYYNGDGPTAEGLVVVAE
jgi:hypothetical protein